MKKNLLRSLELLAPPPARLLNQYRRRDVFRCRHESHRHFNSAVSVYHVLKVKQCHPDGCIWFQWRCRMLGKGAPCPRKYKHVGRACASCPHFYDIKIMRRPEVMISDQAFAQFTRDLRAFETWIRDHQGTRIACSGTVNSVKPRYRLRRRGAATAVVFEGFLLNFRGAFLDTDRFEDFVYLPLTVAQQRRFRIGRGDALHCTGTLVVRDGLIVLEHIRAVEIPQRGEPCFWNESRARVAQRSGRVLPFQAAQCYACDKGILLEVTDEDGCSRGRRTMFCLEGIADPDWCWYSAQRLLHLDACDGRAP